MARYGSPDFDNLIGNRNLPAAAFMEGYEEYTYEGDLPQAPNPTEHIASYSEIYCTSGSDESENTRAAIEFGNEDLPVSGYRHEIVQAISQNKFTIISAETGAGKSTQVAQMLYGAGYRTIQTHPRRIAARNVCYRQREELGWKLGLEFANEFVSYQTAGERDGSPLAPIMHVTDGLELAKELGQNGAPPETVVIIDEVHEANCNMEFLIAWAKKQGATNPNLRFVFMSATMDTHALANYLGEVTDTPPPIIEVPGRSYKVEWHEKPDSTVVKEISNAAIEIQRARPAKDEPNAILAFVPGKAEINDIINELQRKLPPKIAKIATILPLHAMLSPEQQQEALKRHDGITIIVATDVAETSLTIPDVKYVIDGGYQRRNVIDEHGVDGLHLDNISKAESRQRAGRAGRVVDGIYIRTRLNSKLKFTDYEELEEYPLPEIYRTDIARTTLRFAGAGYNIADLDLWNPVEPESITRAQDLLRQFGALDENNQITARGEAMNKYPVGVSAARMMVEAEQFDEVTRACMAVIAAAKEQGGLPYFSAQVGRRWESLVSDETKQNPSDLLAQLDIFMASSDMSRKELAHYNLNVKAVLQAREQFIKIAKLSRIDPGVLTKPSEAQYKHLRHCILTGSLNGIFIRQSDGKYMHYMGQDEPREISDRSLLRNAKTPQVVVGDKYRVEYLHNGRLNEKHVIERGTATTMMELGRAAIELTHWRDDGMRQKGGIYVRRLRRYLVGVDLGETQDEVLGPSPLLRGIILGEARKHHGPNQVRLRGLKQELEALSHLAKDPVPQITEDYIQSLLEKATPEDVNMPWTIDNNLGQILLEKGLVGRESFVSSERYDHIIQNAPARYRVNDDLELGLQYKSGQPLAVSYNKRAIDTLREEVFLPDGRHIKFWHEKKKCSLFELQEKLGISVYA
jgi:ATP-dependent helicase HrpA